MGNQQITEEHLKFVIYSTYSEACNMYQIDINTIENLLYSSNLSPEEKIDKLLLFVKKHEKLLSLEIPTEEDPSTNFFKIVRQVKEIIILINKWLKMGTTPNKMICYLIDDLRIRNLIE